MAAEAASFCPLQVEVRVDRLVPGLHVSPVLSVMVSVDHSKDCMVHVSVLRATSDIEKIEFQFFRLVTSYPSCEADSRRRNNASEASDSRPDKAW
jgi:hypothetical protein